MPLWVDSADRVWLLFAVLVVYGVQGVVHEAAEAALAASALDRRWLADCNGLRMTADEGMKLVAPLVAAGPFARYGGGPVALLDAATFAVAAGVFALLRVREEKPARRGRELGRPGPGRSARRLRSTAEGMWTIRASPVLRPLVLAGAFTMFLAGLNGAAVHALVDRGLGHDPAYAGVLYAVQGAGSVVAGLVAGPLLRRVPARLLSAIGLALFAVAAAARALPHDGVVPAASALIGLGLPWVLDAAKTAVQRGRRRAPWAARRRRPTPWSSSRTRPLWRWARV